MLVLEAGEVFQNEVVEEEAGHFEVVNSQVAVRVGPGDEPGRNVGRPGEAPDDGVEVGAAAEPDSTRAAFAGVAKAYVGR
jgi:hypothetical protein